ncbi:MAG: Daunorubicin/doxorubicin resistance ATP-binding protein DrrA [Ilumatobacteraceae bacterium]|nr:Daunorubicin/doxorubicin resistance ATP-binding protein DrrA [Ilumatobacteraceae bacterium]MCU1391072.1 Daunorubicin/doxorubicin resistance ATP-binding protein DrrA [Ilumatobacteraceae bacterium]
MSPLIEAVGLTKSFGDTVALDGLDLVAERGRVVALLGPNGAGKTTFVRAVATLVRPDGGSLRVDGIDVARRPADVRRQIGLAGQHAAVEPALTGRENLVLVGRLFGLSRRDARAQAAAVLDSLGLNEAADRGAKTYSGGMRRRLDLGASLVGRPRLLLLDEPTTGLDPASRIELWDTIRRLVADGTDVVLTTQYLEEADQLADRIVIIDRGRVVADGTPDELKQRAGRDVIEIHPHSARDLANAGAALESFAGSVPQVDASNRRITLTVDNGGQHLADAIRLLDAGGIVIDDIALRRPTLDEVFLGLVGSTPAQPALVANS